MTGMNSKSYREILKIEREVAQVNEPEDISALVTSGSGIIARVRAKLHQQMLQEAKKVRQPKYELVYEDSRKIINKDVSPAREYTIYRIRALRNIATPFGNIKKGDLGGFVQHENNIYQFDDTWVFDGCVFCGDNAQIRDNSYICDGAQCISNSGVIRNSILKGDVKVGGNGFLVIDDSLLNGVVRLTGNDIDINGALINGKGKQGVVAENLRTLDTETRGTNAAGAKKGVEQKFANIIAGDGIVVKTWASVENTIIRNAVKIQGANLLYCNVSGNVEVLDSVIRNSQISGKANIVQSYVSDGCSIGDNAHITKSNIKDCEMSGGSVVVNCHLDGSKVADNALLIDVEARSQCKFDKSAQVIKVITQKSSFTDNCIVNSDARYYVSNSIVLGNAKVSNSNLDFVVATDDASIFGSNLTGGKGGSAVIVGGNADVQNSIIIVAKEGGVIDRDATVKNSTIQGSFILSKGVNIDNCIKIGNYFADGTDNTFDDTMSVEKRGAESTQMQAKM